MASERAYHRRNTVGLVPPPGKPKNILRMSRQRLPHRRFSVLCSTEDNYKSEDTNFYGPYAHIRKTLDYNYHHNYKKERQWFQDSIIEQMLEDTKTMDVNGGVCTNPTEPFLVFTAGAMGAGKSYTIQTLMEKGRFPLLGFVRVDPDEVRRLLPEFLLYVEQVAEKAGEMTRKESGYICEIVTLAALQAGKNVLVDGSLRDVGWYRGYFQRLRTDYPSLKIAILHITAPREAVFQRAADRAMSTGRVVPRDELKMALEQVPASVKILALLADYYCELDNSPGKEIELLKEGEDWDSFQQRWLQTCAWVPAKLKKSNLRASNLKHEGEDVSEVSSTDDLQSAEFTTEEKRKASLDATKACPVRRLSRSYSVLRSTEMNHKSDDMNFYGPFSHIRRTLDYNYHHNYKKERQWLQDAIITDMLQGAQITDVNGDVCTTPTEPWVVFTAGAMGAGKSHTINFLVSKGRFPLFAFVMVDPDEIRHFLPEFEMYVDQCPQVAGEMTRKEAGYVAEILTLAALQAGKNVLIDGSLRDSAWYQNYFKQLKREYPNVQIAIIHVTAPREAIFQRAADRALHTGRVVPREVLEMALEQVPKSVQILAPLADYFCELRNAPGADDVEMMTDGETWDGFTQKWVQTCAWVPKRIRNGNLDQ